MNLTDAHYNTFARTLTARFAKRATGLDESSTRIVGGRPSDQILAGFLTPGSPEDTARSHTDGDSGRRREDGAGVEGADAVLAEDLPRDSAYEQTAIGLEWIAPMQALCKGSSAGVRVQLHVYLRRLPSFADQRERAMWRAPSRQHADARPTSGGGASGDPRLSDLVAVWTREAPPELKAEIDLGELRQRRRARIDLSAQLAEAWSGGRFADLYPGRRPILVPEVELKSEERYSRWLASLPTGRFPIDWRPVLDVRILPIPTQPGSARIALRVLNLTARVGRTTLDYVDPNLYGVHLTVSVPREAHRPTVFNELPKSFRYDRSMPAVGINAHVAIHPASDGHVTLDVDSVPIKEVARLEPREVEGARPGFALLQTDPETILRRILAEMRSYDAERWERKVRSLDGAEREEAVQARQRFRTEIERFQRGVELLADGRYPLVRRAFSLMNEAMEEAARPKYDEWRLFQIVFIVSQLPALAAREYPELAREDDDDVDVLWFAAGGGKTEAFLGLVLWQAFFDRLRGKRFGVAAVVRFPLRLLAFQQLQRLGRALGAAELIRAREGLGGAKFSMGYFVGNSVTPNSISPELHGRYIRHGVDPAYRRLFECPYCGAETRVGYAAELKLIEHACTNSECSGGDSRLPLYVVDTDVYRFLPTIVVSTVDKLALLGQNQRFSNIFGRVDLICHGHGASFSDTNKGLCPAAAAYGRGERPTQCGEYRVIYGPFHDPAPALLIQDELHLLSEELGAFDAHYETGAMELARSVGARPWKIVAATATIEEYEQHAWQLYLRRSRQFPGPGPEAYESFYYRQNPDRVGRIYAGILGVGRKHTPAVTRALSLLYLELQAARELAAQDLAAAGEVYGTGPLSREEFRYLVFLYELPLTYVLTRKGSDQVAEAIESRVKRELREISPEHGELIVDTFNGGVDVAEMIGAMQRIRTADPNGDPTGRIRGVVATNVIGHGVDVDRFNVMVFAGFTRLVAEYIQASARVGRTFPGISVLVATPQSERDRSIFDRFAKFHEYLDRLVDPSAVTRWPEPALARTVPGLLAGYLMGAAATSVGSSLGTVERVQDLYGQQGAEALNDERIVAWMERAYGAYEAPSPRYRERLSTTTRNVYSSIVNTPRRVGGRPRALNSHLEAMQSLRDVDEPAFVRVEQDQDRAIIRNLTNG